MEGEEQVDAETERNYLILVQKAHLVKLKFQITRQIWRYNKVSTAEFWAKIQITRDADADQHAATRPVELVGTLESLNKAERLIRDVIAEADAGGSPSLVARGFTAAITAGSLEIEMPVPGDKVGLIIGKGGETIRNLQTRSGARIQLIPQNQPGEQAKEKKVKVTGDKKQVDMARELIMEVMNQIWPFKSGQHSFLGVSVGNHNPVSSTEERVCCVDLCVLWCPMYIKHLPGRPSQFSSSNYGQPSYRPRVPGGGVPQWGARGPHPAQTMPYDYHQRGPYPSQNQQYPPQPYGNYPPQGPPRSGFGSWEHRPPTQGPPSHSGGYDYYGQGGGHVGNAPVSAPHSSHMPGHHASGPSMAPHSQANYNYAQPRGPDYAHPTPYSQNAPPAQSYGHGYGEPKYDTQAPMQQQQQPPYAGQGYPPQQQGYAPQQQYNRPPPYGMPPSQGAPPQGYAPPAASQPAADTAYQTPASAAQPYGQNMPPQQQYPQAQYGSAPVTNDGYNQPQPAAAGYPQQAGQPVPAYGQQPTGYAQSAGSTTGYGQYPTTAQASYDPAAAANAAAYGYQGQVDPAAYAAAAGQQVYSATPAVAQQGYAQPGPAQPGYDQTAVAPQSGGYAGAPAGAPAPYGKTLSPQPQPGYPQYDASQQVYAAPR
ncbi:Far upstream element-binding protein 3 [Bienertia sinuspersici]